VASRAGCYSSSDKEIEGEVTKRTGDRSLEQM
jgi:hypothetical protein